jgi:hypothetical protein
LGESTETAIVAGDSKRHGCHSRPRWSIIITKTIIIKKKDALRVSGRLLHGSIQSSLGERELRPVGEVVGVSCVVKIKTRKLKKLNLNRSGLAC